jgi:hypothetical protein
MAFALVYMLLHNEFMRTKPKPKPPSTEPCAAGGCKEPGEYKAPKSRYHTGEYQYLCLKHIREFNQAWDYFDGWSRDEIETFMHSAVHGHRPTWKIGAQPIFTNEKLRESFFRMLGEEPPKDAVRRDPRMPRKEREALAQLDLEPGAGLTQIKAQYKKLVKKYHPDVNKGDKQSEEVFKRITIAYAFLSKLYGHHDEK